MKKRYKLIVEPTLSRSDRKDLSAWFQMILRHRPGYVHHGLKFEYRGSTVVIHENERRHA